MTDAWDGRPQNPERDGWHWLRRVGESTRDAPWLWQESLWCHGPDAFNPDDMIDMGWHYLGPCLTPAEVAAQVVAARREGIEEAAACVRTACVAFANDHSADGPPAYSAAMTIEAAIRALLPGDAALARDFAAWTEGESDGNAE